MYAHGDFFFFFLLLRFRGFFCSLIPIFSSFLSLSFPLLFFFFFLQFDPHFSSFLFLLFFRLLLHILYAGPFESCLFGVDGAALQRYNGKLNIFGPKIWQLFSYFGSLSCPSFTYKSAGVHNDITSYTPVLDGTGTGKLPVLISPWGLFKKCWTSLGGSIGCTIWLETRRWRVQPPPRSATFFRWDWSWNIFYGHSLPSADSRRAVVSFWRKNVHNTG